jgi:hypothetical protein
VRALGARGTLRWPHNNAICPDPEFNTFRTLFVAELSEEEIVRERIGAALRGCGERQVVSVRARPVGQLVAALVLGVPPETAARS